MLRLKLDYLNELLAKKMETLNKIYNITESQNMILLSKDSSPEANVFFTEMNKEKLHLIDEVIDLDRLFQSSFKEIEEELDTAGKEYTDTIKNMQALINEILEKDIAIRAWEQKNKALLDRLKKPSQRPAQKAGKNYILNKYKSNAKKE